MGIFYLNSVEVQQVQGCLHSGLRHLGTKLDQRNTNFCRTMQILVAFWTLQVVHNCHNRWRSFESPPQEVIHQEQLSEITEYLEARRHELQLEDVDFTKLQPMKAAPNDSWL